MLNHYRVSGIVTLLESLLTVHCHEVASAAAALSCIYHHWGQRGERDHAIGLSYLTCLSPSEKTVVRASRSCITGGLVFRSDGKISLFLFCAVELLLVSSVVIGFCDTISLYELRNEHESLYS